MNFLLVDTREKFEEFANIYRTATIIATDTETTGLDPHSSRIRLLQFYSKGLTPVVIDFNYASHYWDLLETFLKTTRKWALHNASFDLKFLWRHGLDLKGYIFDTMLTAQVLDAGLEVKYSLSECCNRYLGIAVDKFEQKTDFSGPLNPEQLEYAALDTVHTYKLFEAQFKSVLRRNLKRIVDIESNCIRPIAQMEYNGFSFDSNRWQAALQDAKDKAIAALTKLEKLAPKQGAQLSLFGSVNINFNSPQAVLKYFGSLGIPITSVNQKEISDLAPKYPIIAAYQTWKKLDTQWRDFVKYLKHINPKTGRLHSSFLQNQAETGRMTSRNPNLQNIPRSAVYRACFGAENRHSLVVADFSQIELRVLAEVTGDRRMVAAYNNDEDLHTITAAALNDIPLSEVTKAQRTEAKPVNFGLIYGAGAKGLLAQARYGYGLTEVDLDWATDKREKFMATYAAVPKWHRSLSNETVEVIETITGRQRHLTKFTDKLTVRANTRIQGPAADITKISLGLLWEQWEQDPYFKFISVVHDEIILECPDDRAEQLAKTLKSCMESAGSQVMKKVKTVADTAIGKNWSECK